MSRKFLGRPRAFLVAILGFLTSAALLVLAIVAYPGGTVLDRSLHGYSFGGNFIGDLGRSISLSGQPSRVAPMFLTGAAITACLALTLFFLTFPRLFKGGMLNAVLKGIGSTAGIAAGLCLIGVALTPVNHYWAEHQQFGAWALDEFTIACLCYVLVMLREERYPEQSAIVFLGFVCLIMGFLGIYLWGPRPSKEFGLAIQVVAQTIIVVAALGAMMVQSWGAYQVTRTEPNELPVSQPSSLPISA